MRQKEKKGKKKVHDEDAKRGSCHQRQGHTLLVVHVWVEKRQVSSQQPLRLLFQLHDDKTPEHMFMCLCVGIFFFILTCSFKKSKEQWVGMDPTSVDINIIIIPECCCFI